MAATHQDDESRRVYNALLRKIRPYRERDVAMASHLSMSAVRLRLRLLGDAGLIKERWVGERGPYWEIRSGQ